MRLSSFDFLASVQAPRTALASLLNRLAINDSRVWALLFINFLPNQVLDLGVEQINESLLFPFIEIIVDRLLRERVAFP
ncbi:MAG: hypothetical protein AAFU64_20295 [Bacteroidota bacterium]